MTAGGARAAPKPMLMARGLTMTEMLKCRWCGMIHGPMCPAIKAIEYADDGITVRRIEFKCAGDYPELKPPFDLNAPMTNFNKTP